MGFVDPSAQIDRFHLAICLNTYLCIRLSIHVSVSLRLCVAACMEIREFTTKQVALSQNSSLFLPIYAHTVKHFALSSHISLHLNSLPKWLFHPTTIFLLFFSLIRNPQTSWFILNSRPVIEIGSPWLWSWM
jgi:hypothetical protein